MRSNALKSTSYTRQDYIQDNFKSGEEPWEVRRARIARQAAQAADLPGNTASADFEEIAIRYRLTPFV